jgi:hypothetical protein
LSTYSDNDNKIQPIYATSWNDKKNETILSNYGTSNAADPALRRRISTKVNRDTGEFFQVKGKNQYQETI